MTEGYKYDFKQLKRMVSVADVAASLGYRIDRKAGLGSYIEMFAGDERNPSDRIIIKNTPSKEMQTYFRRSGGKGDVLEFVRENLSQFYSAGASEWERVGSVMARMANLPVVEHKEVAAARERREQGFDSKRFSMIPLDPEHKNDLLRLRGFDRQTITAFAPYVFLVRDLQNGGYSGFNLGFPYSDASGKLCGFEIRGFNGFKSKAAGTDSSNGCFVADMSLLKGTSAAKDIYMFESAFDAMAFYQANRLKIDAFSSAFVSVGGTFSDNQVKALQQRFPQASFIDCFDNDLAGRIYGARLAALLCKTDALMEQQGEAVKVSVGEREFVVSYAECGDLAEKVAQASGNGGLYHRASAPSGYKDWNDCVLGKRSDNAITPSKYKRDENLRENRTKNMKI